jgi:hypothetical protein
MKGARKGKRPAHDLSDPRESDAEFAGEAEHFSKKRAFKDKDMPKSSPPLTSLCNLAKARDLQPSFSPMRIMAKPATHALQELAVSRASVPLRRKVKASALVVTCPKCQKYGHLR